MNLRQMEYLVMIAETRNISRAAERCFISQSAMSQQLSNIEKELEFHVFHRVNGELKLTREGEIYIRYIREILALYSRAIKEVEECSKPTKSRILIGVSPERGNALMQQIFPIFRESYPEVQFQITEGHLNELEQLVCDHVLDLSEAAYTPLIPSSINDLVKHEDLYVERIMLVMPKTPYYQEKLAQIDAAQDGSVVDLRDFQDESYVLPSERRIRLRSVVDWTFDRAEFSPKITLETSNNVAALNFVAGGGYLSFVPQSYFYSIFAQSDRIIYRVLSQNPYWIRAMIYRKDVKLCSAEKRLLRIIKEIQRPLREKLTRDNLYGLELPTIDGSPSEGYLEE